jgi:hypothetical protein
MSTQSSVITVQDIIDEVRGVIDRIEPYGTDGYTEATTTGNADVLDTAGRTFHEEWFIEQSDHVQRVIAQKAKAFHLDSLVTEFRGNPTRFNNLNTRLRTIHGRVERVAAECSTSLCGFHVARFRGVAEHQMLEQAGRAASVCYPAYTYDDGVIAVYPQTAAAAGDTVKIDYIVHPTQLTATTDSLQIDARFLGAIVAYISSKAFAMMGENEMSEGMWQIYERRIEPLTRQIQIGVRSSFIGPLFGEGESEIE